MPEPGPSSGESVSVCAVECQPLPIEAQSWPVVGAVESSLNVSVVDVPLPATSAPVTAYAKLPLAAAVRVKALDSYGPPAGVVIVSAPLPVQSAGANAGKGADAGPEWESV